MPASVTTTTLATRAERQVDGLTLIDLTIVLGLIVTIALVLAPSIVGVVDESRKVRAQNDCNSLARTITYFRADTAHLPAWLRTPASRPAGSKTGLVLLVGPGRLPVAGTAPGVEAWLDLDARRIGTDTAFLLTVGADPWNNRYAVNAAFLTGTDGTQDLTRLNKRAVWVLSAGPNGIVETPFSQPARSAVLAGDDIGTRIQ